MASRIAGMARKQPSELILSRETHVVGRPPRKRRLAFGWYGGKFGHLDWLLPLLPAAHHYCEPFGGSAAVLINRSPSPVETLNDLDGEITNFFRMLRERSDDLVRVLALTPFSREEFYVSLGQQDGVSEIERARRFFVRARQVRTGLAQTASLGRWANCKNTSRSGMSGVVSRWLGSVERLPELAERLLRVQIENRPATEVVEIYDDKSTLFYCDPPYVHATRGDRRAYGFEMDDTAHRDLARVLKQCRGKVAISGYSGPLMNDLYGKWRRFDAPEKNCHSIKRPRQESLWMNY